MLKTKKDKKDGFPFFMIPVAMVYALLLGTLEAYLYDRGIFSQAEQIEMHHEQTPPPQQRNDHPEPDPLFERKHIPSRTGRQPVQSRSP